ncbi:MAG: hypothetical protein R3B93_11680 [Bacteroidia bacterium]
MKNIGSFLLVPFFLFALSEQVFGQQVLLDQGVRVEGVWCFPSYSDSLSWLFLPEEARLALDEAQHPQFSFMRYIINEPTEKNSDANTLSDADGGGILNFLVTYDTDSAKVKAAEAALKEVKNNQEIRLTGPVIFEEGRYSLVSSILDPASGKQKRQILTSGSAPVMAGSRIALTFELDPKYSKLLLESFKMATPDVALVFDMTFSGLSQSYDATIEVDWSEVQKSQSGSASGSLYFIGMDVEAEMSKMMRNNAIKLTTNGGDAYSEALISTVYNKLLDLMFQPVEPASLEGEERGGLMDALSTMVDPKGPLSSQKTLGFGANIGYKYKDVQTSGKSIMKFNGRVNVERHHFITFQIGDIYQRLGHDERYFKDVPLWDPAFQQRSIFVGLDGKIQQEFSKIINSLTVTMRKKHQDGSETIREIVLNEKTLTSENGPLEMIYGSRKDSNRMEWMNYQYRTNWQFQGGASFQSEWIDGSSAMINLFTPFRRHEITLDGDMDMITGAGVRAVMVEINYDFFNEPKKERITLRAGQIPSDQSFELILPANQYEVDYSLTWVKSGGEKETRKGKDDVGLIFVDEMGGN